MLIWTARISKKTKAVVAVILAGILVAAVILLAGRSHAGRDAASWQLDSNADRVAYLESMGFEFDESTAKYKGEKMVAVYLKQEFGGFAVHLLQK